MKFSKKVTRILIIGFFGIGVCLSDCFGMEKNADAAGTALVSDFCIQFVGNTFSIYNSDTRDESVVPFIKSLSEAAHRPVKILIFMACNALHGSFNLTTFPDVVEADFIDCKGVTMIPQLPDRIKKIDFIGCGALSVEQFKKSHLPSALRMVRLPDETVIIKKNSAEGDASNLFWYDNREKVNWVLASEEMWDKQDARSL